MLEQRLYPGLCNRREPTLSHTEKHQTPICSVQNQELRTAPGGGNTSKFSGGFRTTPTGPSGGEQHPNPVPICARNIPLLHRRVFSRPYPIRFPNSPHDATPGSRFYSSTVYRCKPLACTYFAHHRCLTPRTRTGPSPGRA